MPERLLSQLAHVEVLTPKPQESLEFFTQVLGLEESGRAGQSVYLRGWGERYHHSLQLTEAEQPGLAHIGWRADGPEQLEKLVARIEATGQGEGWFEDAFGHGPAYRFRSVGGHLEEVFWQVDYFETPPELASTFPNRPQRFSARGAAARYLDHVTVATKDIMADVAFHRDALGSRFMEYIVAPDNEDFVIFATLTACERNHDLGLVPDFSGIPGRVNHVSYWVDQREHVTRAADVILEAGGAIEFGPGRHGISEQDFLYFREPGGNRIEINSGGYRNYDPEYGPVRWLLADGANVFYRNLDLPHSMFECFPPDASGAAVEAFADTGFVA